MADEGAREELERLQLEKARREAAEQARRDRLELEAAHDEANAMKAREKDAEEQKKYDESLRGRARKFFSRGKGKNSGGGGDDGGNDDSGSQGGGNGKQSYLTNVIKMPSKGYLWLIILLFVIVIGILWYKSQLRPVLVFLLTWGGLILLIGFIAWGLISGIKDASKKDPDSYTKLFISWALTVWLVDMIPIDFPVIGRLIGPPFSGFELPLLGVLVISIVPVLTSSVMFAWLYLNMIFNITSHQYLSFLLGFFSILIINNVLVRIFPNSLNLGFSIFLPNWQGLWAITYYVGMAILFIGLVWAVIHFDKKKSQEVPGFFSSLFMIFVFSFFWVNQGWAQNPRAVLHAIFIISFGFGYIKPHEKANPAVYRILIPLLLILDFYGYGLLWSLPYLWVKFIPLFVLFVISYCYHKTESSFALITFIVLVTIILILSLDVTAYAESGAFDYKAQTGGADFTQFFSALGTNTKLLIERQLVFATGGLYRSQVELNQYTPLGVFFERVRTAQPKFYDDEPVTIWATVSAKTLSEPVNVNFNCYRWRGNERIGISKDDVIVPDKPFQVNTYEEKDVECNFKQSQEVKKFDIGSNNKITLSLTYNFATSAYQKMYFMDRDRLRALTRESIDPLKQYGITDLSSIENSETSGPAAVYTNGPVEIAVETQKLVATPPEPTQSTSFILGILLKNRNQITDKNGQPVGEWEGKIRKINELVVVLPEGLEIQPTDCHPVPFNSYTKENCLADCKNPGTAENTKCTGECESLFRADDNSNSYRGYKLDTSWIRDVAYYQDVSDRYKAFNCRISASKTVLDNSPITTRFIRIKAKYDYLIEKSYDVTIEKAPVPFDEYGPLENGYLPLLDEDAIKEESPYSEPNTDIEAYLEYKKSPLKGLGSCMQGAEKRTSVPASVILSVALLESKAYKPGYSQLSGVAVQANNLFGIKCTDSWVKTKCPTPGDKDKCCKSFKKSNLDLIYEPNSPNSYRVYGDKCASVNNFADFIGKGKRYQIAMGYTNDPETMISKIREAGYATDPKWADVVKAIYMDTQKFISAPATDSAAASS